MVKQRVHHATPPRSLGQLLTRSPHVRSGPGYLKNFENNQKLQRQHRSSRSEPWHRWTLILRREGTLRQRSRRFIVAQVTAICKTFFELLNFDQRIQKLFRWRNSGNVPFVNTGANKIHVVLQLWKLFHGIGADFKLTWQHGCILVQKKTSCSGGD